MMFHGCLCLIISVFEALLKPARKVGYANGRPPKEVIALRGLDPFHVCLFIVYFFVLFVHVLCTDGRSESVVSSWFGIETWGGQNQFWI